MYEGPGAAWSCGCDVLKVLAQGLAALPAIRRLIKMMKDKWWGE